MCTEMSYILYKIKHNPECADAISLSTRTAASPPYCSLWRKIIWPVPLAQEFLKWWWAADSQREVQILGGVSAITPQGALEAIIPPSTTPNSSPTAIKRTQSVLPTYCTESPHHCLENSINLIYRAYAHTKQLSYKINCWPAQIITGETV